MTSSDNKPKNRSRKQSYATILVLVLIIIASFYYYDINQSKGVSAPNINVTLYAGEISATLYGFGFSSSNLTSPGPTLTLKVGDVVEMTLHNVGKMPHSFEVNTQNNTNGQVLFNSEISPRTYIQPNQIGSVVFKVTMAGDFYYICPVPGHAELGMWGPCKITS